MIKRQLIVLVALSLAIAGCGPAAATHATVRTVATPDVSLFGIEWMDSDTLIVEYTPDETAAFQLARVSIDGETFDPIPVPPAPDCRQLRIGNPARITATELAVTAECASPVGSGTPDRTSVLALDLADETYTARASAGETAGPAGQVGVGPGSDGTLVGMGSLCGVIVEAATEGPVPIDLEVVDGGSAFSLADAARGPDCAERGWAKYPTVSAADGSTAFFASPSAIGLDGPARGSAPASLYIAAPGVTSVSPVLSGVIGPRALKFAPDGASLAFGGEIDGVPGTWVLDVTSGVPSKVIDDTLQWLSWSPDGQSLAGVVAQAGVTDQGRIVILPVAASDT